MAWVKPHAIMKTPNATKIQANGMALRCRTTSVASVKEIARYETKITLSETTLSVSYCLFQRKQKPCGTNDSDVTFVMASGHQIAVAPATHRNDKKYKRWTRFRGKSRPLPLPILSSRA